MKTDLNPNFQARDTIIFGSQVDWTKDGFGGIKRFEDLSLEQLSRLSAEGFIDLDGSQNSSPTAGEFLAFMERHPEVKAHGYAVSPQRSDYRVSIEGLMYSGPVSSELFKEFVELCRLADDFTVNDDGIYAWWD